MKGAVRYLMTMSPFISNSEGILASLERPKNYDPVKFVSFLKFPELNRSWIVPGPREFN